MKNGLNGFGNNMDLTPCYVSFVSPRDDFGDWDGRDQAMSQELSGVSDVPIGPQTPFFGSGGPVGASNSDPLSDDTSVVDLRGTSAADANGVVPLISDLLPYPLEVVAYRSLAQTFRHLLIRVRSIGAC